MITDRLATAINLWDSAKAWRADASNYKGWRRTWRLEKARALEHRGDMIAASL